MSEQPVDGNAAADEEKAGATEEAFGNLSVEDNPDGTTDPAELAADTPQTDTSGADQ